MELVEEMPQLALDVLSTVLIEPYSEEDVEREASTWEMTNGSLLMRPWESMEQFIARSAGFESKVKPLALNMDPSLARREFDRLMEGIDDPKKMTAQQSQRANELEQIIGRAKTNFTKAPSREEVQRAAKERYASYVREEDFAKRVGMVRTEAQRYVVELLVKYEKNESVRAAATQRLAELDVLGS